MAPRPHEYHGLYWHLGPFGRQDVHLHPCITHERCGMEMVGVGRDCGGRETTHVPKKLLVGDDGWKDKHHEGEALVG